MNTLEEYLDEERQRNRALTRTETPLVDQWFDVAHNVAIDGHNSGILMERKEWCEFNIKGFWTVIPLNRYNRSYRVYRFNDQQDAMLFKLTFGGCSPPSRHLP